GRRPARSGIPAPGGSRLALRKGVDAALQLAAAPAAGPRVRGVFGQRGAGFAADARVAQVVLRQITQALGAGVLPHLRPAPVGAGADLPQHLAGWQPVLLGFAQVTARRRLLAAQPGEPDVEGLERRRERFDLAQLAAAGRLVAIENAQLGLLLGHRALG